MRCGKKLNLLFLVLFLAFSQFLVSSLSEEEIATLPELKKEALIEIILIYDQELSSRESSLIEKENELTVRESDLNRSENLLATQEELFLKSLQIKKTEKIKNSIMWGVGGFAVGVVTYLVFN